MMAPRPGPISGGCPARAACPPARAAAAAAGPRSVRTDGRDCTGRAQSCRGSGPDSPLPQSLFYRCAYSVCAGICPRVGLLHAHMFANQDRGHRRCCKPMHPDKDQLNISKILAAQASMPSQRATAHHDQSSHPNERA